MKHKLGGKIMTKFVGFRAKTYSYLIDDGSEGEKVKGTNKRVLKRKLKFENFRNSLEVTKLANKINHLEKNKTNVNSNIKEVKRNS